VRRSILPLLPSLPGPEPHGLQYRYRRVATISYPSRTSQSRTRRSGRIRRRLGGNPVRLARARMPQRLQGRNPSTSRFPSPTSTRSTSRTIAYGSAANSSVCGNRTASIESLLTGNCEGRPTMSAPEASPGAATIVWLRVRLQASNSRAPPHAPICSNSQPKTSSSASPSSSDSAASRARPSVPCHQALSAASRSRMRELRTGTIRDWQ